MRYSSIDILRTFAIFVMVLVHFGENLSGYKSPFTGFGAPLFAFLSGVSYWLWVQGQEAKGTSEEDISKISVRRGLFVFGVGFAFNILVWLPEDTFNWDVLTFVGAALLLLNIARRIPLPVSVLVAVIALAISPLLQHMADYNSYWQNGYYDPDLTFSDVTIGFLAVGYFPFFPWITFSLVGLVTASLLFAEPVEKTDPPPSPWPTVLMGTALIAASFSALYVRSYLPTLIAKKLLGGWTMFPPTIEYVLGTLGMTLVLLGLTHRFVDRAANLSRYESWLNIAKTFSRYSLTIYVVHHLVHIWPLWIYGIVMGQEPTYYWMKAMPLYASFPLAFVFLAVCYAVLRWLGPERSYGIESWMRWLCD